jgi:hypothetical protein
MPFIKTLNTSDKEAIALVNKLKSLDLQAKAIKQQYEPAKKAVIDLFQDRFTKDLGHVEAEVPTRFDVPVTTAAFLGDGTEVDVPTGDTVQVQVKFNKCLVSEEISNEVALRAGSLIHDQLFSISEVVESVPKGKALEYMLAHQDDVAMSVGPDGSVVMSFADGKKVEGYKTKMEVTTNEGFLDTLRTLGLDVRKTIRTALKGIFEAGLNYAISFGNKPAEKKAKK